LRTNPAHARERKGAGKRITIVRAKDEKHAWKKKPSKREVGPNKKRKKANKCRHLGGRTLSAVKPLARTHPTRQRSSAFAERRLKGKDQAE